MCLVQSYRFLLANHDLFHSTTTCANIVALVGLLSPHDLFSHIAKTALILTSMALQNIMGCKAFRLLRMSIIEHDASTQAESSVRFATWYTTTHTLSSDDAEVIQPVPVSVSLNPSIWAQHWQINIHSSTSSYEKTTPCASFSGQLPYYCFILISV